MAHGATRWVRRATYVFCCMHIQYRKRKTHIHTIIIIVCCDRTDDCSLRRILQHIQFVFGGIEYGIVIVRIDDIDNYFSGRCELRYTGIGDIRIQMNLFN